MSDRGLQAYHVLRMAVEVFRKQPSELPPEQLNAVRARAAKTRELEDRVLSSAEAARVSVPAVAVDTALDQVRKRYESVALFETAMRDCALTQDDLHQALWRELTFDAVISLVGDGAPPVTDPDIETFYADNPKRFETPELRTARHILITINSDHPDNTLEAASARIKKLHEELTAHPEKFAKLAAKYSECPSALDEGRLGQLPQGKLYPPVDAALFHLQEGGVSEPVESEVGLHLVLCEHVTPAKTLPLDEVYEKVRTYLIGQRRTAKQKSWLYTLKPQLSGESQA